MLGHIPDLIEVGIDSFKIEGRMKSIHYVATVVNVYRQAIDSYMADPDHYVLKPEWIEEINKAANRPLNTGFFYDTPDHEDHIYEPEEKAVPYDFAGLVMEYDEKSGTAVIQRNHFKPGDEIEFSDRKEPSLSRQLVLLRMRTAMNLMHSPSFALIRMKVDQPVRHFDMMRKRKG